MDQDWLDVSARRAARPEGTRELERVSGNGSGDDATGRVQLAGERIWLEAGEVTGPVCLAKTP